MGNSSTDLVAGVVRGDNGVATRREEEGRFPSVKELLVVTWFTLSPASCSAMCPDDRVEFGGTGRRPGAGPARQEDESGRRDGVVLNVLGHVEESGEGHASGNHRPVGGDMVGREHLVRRHGRDLVAFTAD